MHVLDFTEKPEYARIASLGFSVVYAGPAFAHWLLEKNVLEEVSGAAREGDFALYFNEEGKFKHAGAIAANGRIVSSGESET
jgi:hypothetical protein